MAFNPLDPLGSIRDLLVDLNNKLTGVIESVVINSGDSANTPLLNPLYVTGQNLAIYLAYMVFVLVLILGTLLFHKIERIGKALITYLVIITLTPSWLYIVDQMYDAGTSAANGVKALYDLPLGGAGDPFSNIDNTLGAILALLTGLSAGGGLAIFMGQFAYLIVVFKLFAPIAYSVSTIGKRCKFFANLVLAIGLDVTLFGRPFAVFFIELGQVLMGTFPAGKTPFFAVLYTALGYGAAGLSQIVLIIVGYKGLIAVEGKVVAWYKGGGVKSFIQNIAQVDIRKIQRNSQAGMRPMPVKNVGDQAPQPTVRDHAHHAAKQAAATAAVTVTAVGATYVVGSVAGPTAGAKAGAATKKVGGNYVKGMKPRARSSQAQGSTRRTRRR